jgi:hypothetical protein
MQAYASTALSASGKRYLEILTAFVKTKEIRKFLKSKHEAKNILFF